MPPLPRGLSRVRSASRTSGNAPVYLNVYDLTPINGYMYWAGLGIFHTGVEVHGVEYAFGAHDYPTSGVFEVEPHQCPGFRFRKSIFMGTTCLDPFQVREFMEIQSVNYNGDTYHLITKNCNHFCQDICFKLTGNSIPKWVNRLARIGSLCNCLLPEALKITAVQHDPVSQTKDASPSTPNSPTNGWWLTVDRDELGLLPPLSALLPEAPAVLVPNESFLISSSASKSFPFSLNTCNQNHILSTVKIQERNAAAE
ncbi:ethylene-responsive element-binding protein [Musa troglodytarum]|uniref:Ethylene-responsive element-binding protein n=1 Tax=Musa troglodytarum TaxID=320322 RepID=A0A9E7HVP1_9LILI|nr:ethylene-responsive element-binding protein [Musa troglodytarum]URE36412.1 ethylene-responsive element-binding protein [Musa troglodytarum]